MRLGELNPAVPRCDVPRKSLCLIPFRFAIEMVRRGWLLRNVIIWHKPNVVPESVKDRFTLDFEYLFFFAKSPRYYFQQQFEPSTQPVTVRDRSTQRNKRCVWSISTRGFAGNHFAAYPEALLETPIAAGCPVGGVVLDPFLGTGTTALAAERLGRRWIGIELNPAYVQLAQERLHTRRRGRGWQRHGEGIAQGVAWPYNRRCAVGAAAAPVLFYFLGGAM
jgi:site-specific DNA-methyltransferase (cytosine-N4-specific)